LRDLGKRLGFLQPRQEDDEAQGRRFMETGFLWETVLAMAMAERYDGECRPGELKEDGITGSPDGVLPSPVEGLILIEDKCTWTSLRKPVEERWLWLCQIKAYCHMLGTLVANLRVLYVCGDYKPPFPQYRKYRITFSRLEIQENWEMILRHKNLMEKEKEETDGHQA